MSRRSEGNNMAHVEGALEKAFERPFSRLFRSPLQPAEIEKAALREVEKSRKLGANVIYVANVYSVVIAPADEENLGDLLDTLESDLATRIYAYASNNNYQMKTRPVVRIVVDETAKMGEVYAIGEVLSEKAIAEEFGPEALPEAPAPRTPVAEPHVAPRTAPPSNGRRSRDPYLQGGFDDEKDPYVPPIPRSSAPVTPAPATFAPTGDFSANPALDPRGAAAAASPEELRSAAAAAGIVGAGAVHAVAAHPAAARDDSAESTVPLASAPATAALGPRALITVNDQPPFVLQGQDAYLIGRKGSCDILLEDPQASRQHAQLIREDAGWAIADLNSTNGTRLNGKPVTHALLHDGDVVNIGNTTIAYREAAAL